MAAQAGVHYFDGRPVDPETELRSDDLARHGTDGVRSVTSAGFLMVHAHLIVTPEDEGDECPLKLASGDLVTWDGRLDNRRALVCRLGPLAASTPDSQIVACALQAWGDAALKELIGDWSLVWWRASDRSVVLASDCMGIRPLYYQITNSELRWSTLLRPLLRRHRFSGELDPRFIVGFLGPQRWPEASPFVGIESVPGGTAILVSSRGKVTRREFWRFGNGLTRSRSVADYAEGLRFHLTQSVASRLRAKGQVWAELSGGMDSSSIVCLAHRLTVIGECPAVDLHTVTYVSDSAPQTDERRFAAEVVEATGLPNRMIPMESLTYYMPPADVWISPALPRRNTLAGIDSAMSAGGRVLVSGRFGDSIMGNVLDQRHALSSLLRHGELASFCRRAHAAARRQRTPIAFPVLLALLLRASGAPSVRGILRALSVNPAGLPVLDEERLVSEYSLSGELASAIGPPPSTYEKYAEHRDPGQRLLLEAINRYSSERLLENPAELGPITLTYVFVDRRLLEYVLSLPAWETHEVGAPRSLMKAAVRDVLPKRICERFSKGQPQQLKLKIFRSIAGHMLKELPTLQIIQRGYVDRESLRNRLEDIIRGKSGKVGNLFHCHHLELWLRVKQITARAA